MGGTATRAGQPHRGTAVAGFTLLELIVAVALLAVLASAGYGGLTQILNVQAQTDGDIEALRRVQVGMEVLARDLGAAAPRPAIGEDGVLMAPFRGNAHGLELTRGGAGGPLVAGVGVTSGLGRVRYRWAGSMLQRGVWAVLDRAGDSELGRERVLMQGIADLRFRYLDDAGALHSRWPVADEALPRAVELTAEIAGLGPVRRLWLVH